MQIANFGLDFIPYFCMCCLIVALTSVSLIRNFAWSDAMTLWEDVAQKSPRNARAYNNLGESYHSRGMLEKAIENYSRAIAISPGYSLNAYTNIGSLYITRRQYDEAIEYFSRALAIDANDPFVYANRGIANYALGRYAKAIEDYTRAIGINPYFAQFYSRRGSAFLMTNNRTAALGDFQRACSLGDEDGCARLRGAASGMGPRR